MNKSLIILTTILVGLICAVGCESDAQTGALIGTGIGAGVGALAGGSTEGTLIGAAVGGGAGYMLGNEGDKKKAESDRNAIRQEINTVTVWVTNSNSSKIPVNLTKNGPNYIGPRGEQYDHLPTSEELRPVYGF